MRNLMSVSYEEAEGGKLTQQNNRIQTFRSGPVQAAIFDEVVHFVEGEKYWTLSRGSIGNLKELVAQLPSEEDRAPVILPTRAVQPPELAAPKPKTVEEPSAEAADAAVVISYLRSCPRAQGADSIARSIWRERRVSDWVRRYVVLKR